MAPNLDQISAFLVDRFGPVADLTILQGGAWSNAFSFRTGERRLVLRVGPHRDDFDKELAATTWREPGLHVPDVIDVGEAFDGHHIVSQYHHGTKLADLDPSQVRGRVAGKRIPPIEHGRIPAIRTDEMVAPADESSARSRRSTACTS